MWWVLQGVVGIAGIIHRNKKKFFSFFTLTPSQMWLKRPVYRGFKCEGWCEGRAFTLTPALTLPSHFRHRKVSCQGVSLQNLTKVPEKYSYLVPTVQHRYTNSIAMLHYQYSNAALLVQGCCTFGARGLHFYRHYYSKVFTVVFLAVVELRFFCNTILNSIIGFPSGRRTLFLHSKLLIRFAALCKPAATELESKNAHGISDFFRSLLTDPFFDLFFLIFF